MTDTVAPRKTFNQPDAVALREHLECKIRAQHEYFEARIASLEKASGVASDRLQERLSSMNEFRAAMGDMSAKMVTRSEMCIQMDKLDIQIDDLRKSRDQLEGKASQKSVDVALFFGAAGTIVGVAGLLLHLLTM